MSGTSTNPPLINGVIQLTGYASFPPSQSFTNNGSTQFPILPQYPVVPGQAMVRMQSTDPIHNSLIDDFVPLFFNVCGVVPDTITGYVFNDLDANGVRNPGEPGIPNVQVALISPSLQYFNYYALTDSIGFYSILAPNASFLVAPSTLPAVVTFPATGSYILDGAVNDTFPEYDFGVSTVNTVISGNVYLDFNQNNIFDPGNDALYNYATIKAENLTNGITSYEISYNNGSYIFNLTTGNYRITATGSQLDSATANPDTIFINSTGGTFAQQDFGLSSPVSGNLGVRIFGSGEARPGFNYQSVINVQNTGFDTISGVLIFTFDSLLTASSADTVSGVIDNLNHTVTWPTGIMPAVSSSIYEVNYTIPLTITLGTPLNFQAQVITDPGYTDNDPANNNDYFIEIVTGSFDPNDKKVDPVGVGLQNNVLHTDRLHYRIRFQNTGTATAINVFVQDEIDPQLDLKTFLMERTSHDYDLFTNGNVFTWTFLNIMLPDSNANEPDSHGFIEYSIKPIQGLPDGTEIENTAAIYFDFNEPVITNTTLNTLQTTLVSVLEINDAVIQIFPVPVTDQLTIRGDFGLSIKSSIEILDINGRSLHTLAIDQSKGVAMTVDVSSLSAGLYMIRVTTGDQVLRKMFVKN